MHPQIERCPIPTPEIQIGQLVKRDVVLNSWFRMQCIKKWIRYYREWKTKHGQSGKICDWHKVIILKNICIMDTAYAVQVVGIVPLYGLAANHYNSVNQCYIPGVRGAASPIMFGAELLFRAEIEAGWGPDGVLDRKGTHMAHVSIIAPQAALIYKKDIIQETKTI